MKNGQNPDPSPFCEAKGGREHLHLPLIGGDSEGVLQGVHTAPSNHVIPAQAGNQRKTKHAAFPSPSMGKGQGEGDQSPNLDVEAARASMNRMANIFADIAKHAEDSSLTRCPYKDARSRCTAKFACRNQHFTKNPLNPPICTAKDGDLNYRSAWEID